MLEFESVTEQPSLKMSLKIPTLLRGIHVWERCRVHHEGRDLLDAIAERGEPTSFVSRIEGTSQDFK